MSFRVAACDKLIGVFEQTEEAFDELKNLETAIFETLQESDALAAVEDVVLSLSLLKNRPEEAVAEVANMIAAAAAVERKSYQNLVTLVANLAESGNESLATLPDTVVLRCLLSHPAQTNYFLLQLYNRGLLDLHLLYKFLSIRGTFRVPNMLIFVYFYPELEEKYGEWAQKEFKSCHTAYRYRKLTYSNESCSVVEPTEWRDGERPIAKASDINWEEHKQKRENFFGVNEIAKYIRENDTEKLIARVDGTDFNVEIKYDMYDQVTHPDIPDTFVHEVENRYGSNRTETVPIKAPHVIQAICMNGSEECWNALCNLTGGQDKALRQLKTSGKEVIIGGSSQLLELLAGTHIDTLNDILPVAVKYHRNAEMEWLMEQDCVTADIRSVEAAIQYANFDAFQKLVNAGAHKVGSLSRSIFNICGEHNAVNMLKYGILKADEVFDPYVSSSTGKNFLHSAALHMSVALVKWWGNKFGNLGFDAVDQAGRNPSHYACTFAINKKVPRNEDGVKAPIEIRNPFYRYMAKRTDSSYAVETDPCPEE